VNFEVYAYWNSVELAAVFNAIAAITGNADFNGLLRTLALVAVLSLSIAVLAGRGRHDDFWRWFIMLAIFHGILLVPKSNVVIVDRTGTAPAQTVANVPLGLASLAHGTSKIGDWLTTAFEAAFSLPDDVQLRKNGTLFGHRVMRERLMAGTANPILLHNLMEFYRECIWPDLATGYLSSRDLSEAPDIWTLFNNSNPGLLVTILDYANPASSSTMACPAAYATLTGQLGLDVDQQLGAIGTRLYPGMAASLAKTAFTGSLATTTNYLLGVSQGAQDILKQAIIGNTLIDAEYAIPAQLGDAAQSQVKLAQAQAIRSFNTSYGTMMALADETMPKLRNAVEILTYALFPVVVLIIVVSGQFAFTFLKAYLGSMFWVQLWPPLYAVTNFIMNTKAASGLSGATAGDGLALKYYNYLGSAVASDQAIAGVLAIAIPVIAYGVVQASMAAANSVVSAVTAGGAYGAAASQGNLSLGNATLDTAKAGVHSAGQYNTAPTMRSGLPVETHIGAGVATSVFADGTAAVDASAMQHRMNLRLNAGSRIAAGFQRQSEQAETAAVGNLVSAATTTAAALQQSADFVRTHAAGERAGERYGVADQVGFAQSVNRTQKVIESFAKKKGLDQTQSAEILGMAAASIHNPKTFDLVSPVSVQAAVQMTGKSSATAKQLLEDARNYARESGFSDTVDTVRRAAHETSFDRSDESNRKAMAGIRGSLDRSQQHVDQASVSHQRVHRPTRRPPAACARTAGAWEAGLAAPVRGLDGSPAQRLCRAAISTR
jgi:conjugal transfer mating pair stabilization protein TraG